MCRRGAVRGRGTGVLGASAEQQGRRGPSDPGSAAALAARLGGYRGRKHDPAPGNRIMWEGYCGPTLAAMGCRLRGSRPAARKRRALTGVQTRFMGWSAGLDTCACQMPAPAKERDVQAYQSACLEGARVKELGSNPRAADVSLVHILPCRSHPCP